MERVRVRPPDRGGLDGSHQDDRCRTRFATQRRQRIDIVLDTGGTSSLWWATRNEWLGLIDVAGLELEALYGGFERQPFDDASGEYVFVALKP